jgi:hypothetical protein
MLGEYLGYNQPENAIVAIYKRNAEELDCFSQLAEFEGAGGKRQRRIFSEQGCYVVAMLAKTDRAKAFRRALALWLSEERDALTRRQRIFQSYDEENRKLRERNNKLSREFAEELFVIFLAKKRIPREKATRIIKCRHQLTHGEIAKLLRIKVYLVQFVIDLWLSASAENVCSVYKLELIGDMLCLG